MRPEFGEIIKSISDRTGKEVTAEMIWEAFEKEYLLAVSPLSFDSCEKRKDLPQVETCGSPETVVSAVVDIGGQKRDIAGKGNGPIDAFSRAIGSEIDIDFKLISYYEHALDKGSDSRAVAYIQIEDEKSRRFWGAGIDTNIETASFRAILSALNRSQRKEKEEL